MKLNLIVAFQEMFMWTLSSQSDYKTQPLILNLNDAK